ncbi:alkaline phosphatase family protein [Haloechinothrix sp. LS1_15]|uniref:alkaline phosphatase family protein n=1 Tax=Haloechinothrix sp. LS1_15 TaxID=2652248 RepID=UPI002944456D|nr:alkaline phosphatase family protein [Haloechinothrix sp. LS1_15]MDV6011802.1 alkaline phosphatase family protein [Haloechinothrix sp. LS1_15]
MDAVSLPGVASGTAHLSEVTPSALAALGVDGFTNTLELPDVRSACVLLIDGLGAELLDEHAADAPTLTELRAGTLHVGFPSTTASGLAAIGTGVCSGEHGMVGYSFELGNHGVVNALRWNQHPYGEDLRDQLSPEEVQPLPTAFERAAGSGVGVSVVSSAAFGDSGLTRAVLRGSPYTGVHGVGDLVAATATALADGGYCHGYHADLDLLGHIYGPGSAAWRMQLRQVDRLVESLVEQLPPGSLLAVVADHGMVAVDDSAVDADAIDELGHGVRAIGGEVRARYVYTEPGALDDVRTAWRETLGDRALVVERDEAIEAGWFGTHVADHVVNRIGDLVVATRGRSGILRRTVEPIESSLPGHHGSITPAEQLVPLLLARG